MTVDAKGHRCVLVYVCPQQTVLLEQLSSLIKITYLQCMLLLSLSPNNFKVHHSKTMHVLNIKGTFSTHIFHLAGATLPSLIACVQNSLLVPEVRWYQIGTET